MATIIQLAKNILDKKGQMTTMKLQKLCYYCQAWSLAWDETPLFEEDFEAWANGPVCPDLYEIHRGKFSITSQDISDNCKDVFNDSQEETINKVLDYYGDKEPHWLSELTHKEQPWRLARGTYRDGERCQTIISKDSMQQYYSGLV